MPDPSIFITIISNPMPMVSQPVTLECDITLDVNITARVDIVWKKDGLEFSRLERVSGHSAANGGIQYRVFHSIDMVAIEDHNVVYQCGMVISTRVIASNNLTLIVNCKSSCTLLVNIIPYIMCIILRIAKLIISLLLQGVYLTTLMLKTL